MLIQGIVCPVGKRNENGWGISEADVEMAITTLTAAPLRVCSSRSAPHECDIVEDPKSEIGGNINAWRDGDFIWARAEVKDSEAKQKLTDGVWPYAWSIAGKGKLGNDGLTSGGFTTKGLTLVRKGAWNEAVFDIVASEGDESVFRAINPVEVYAPIEKDLNNQNGDKMVGEEEGNLKALVASLEQKVSDLEKANQELTASAATKDTEIQTLTASLKEKEGSMSNMVPKEMLDNLVAAKISEYDLTQKKTAAIGEYKSLLASAGREMSEAEAKFLEAAPLDQIQMFTERFSDMLTAGARPNYSGSGKTQSAGLTVGIPDGKGGWKTE